MSFLKQLVVVAVVLVVVVLGIIYVARPVALVAPVVRGRAIMAVPGSVSVQAERTLPLSIDVGGRIMSQDFNLDPGQRVRDGEVLARLDTRTIDLEIQRIKGEMEAAQRRMQIGSPIEQDLQNAQDALANGERLFASGNLSETELNRQRRLVTGLEQKLALERAADEQLIAVNQNTLRVKQLQREEMTVQAPRDGQISEVFVNPEQLIGSGTTLAMMITNPRTIEARVSEENFAALEVGQRASVRFLGLGDQLFDATIARILPTVDPATQRYIVRLNVEVDAKKLAPGLTGEVNIIINARDNALIIPRRALFGSSVYVVRDGRIQLRPIKIGYTSLNVVEVLEGLEENELVVVEQLERYRSGDRVRTRLESGSS